MADGKKKIKVESLFYNNKFLMVFSVVLAVIIWGTAKINYSAETVRTVSDVRVSLTNTLTEGSDYIYFVDEEKLYVDVEISGKAYNINSKAITKDDIIVEATGTYIDSSGYKLITLTARVADGVGGYVNINSVSPSTIAVFFDRKITSTFNVSAKLKNGTEGLVQGKYTVGQPVPSMSTVDITGPATILNRLQNVYFEAEIPEDKLPLTASLELPAEISYKFEGTADSRFLTVEGINNESNPPKVTVPVSVVGKVPVGVKFLNPPSVYTENPPEVEITPSEVEISYNPKDGDKYDVLYVGSVDFREVSDSVNTFDFKVDEKLGVNVVDKQLDKIVVKLDMSSMERRILNGAAGKIVYINQDENFDYNVDFSFGNLEELVVIGPEKSLQKITAEDIQIELNVSTVNLARAGAQIIEVSNISIQSEEVDDCWIYGKYTVRVSASMK
ncbi:MAG: hypothetical protein UHM85_11015 [Acutalibacteraceae bacterium]|nr:hypothetical protein [Acutalibacteraceae bacterium]